jgi:hypothetical protein
MYRMCHASVCQKVTCSYKPFSNPYYLLLLILILILYPHTVMHDIWVIQIALSIVFTAKTIWYYWCQMWCMIARIIHNCNTNAVNISVPSCKTVQDFSRIHFHKVWILMDIQNKLRCVFNLVLCLIFNKTHRRTGYDWRQN